MKKMPKDIQGRRMRFLEMFEAFGGVEIPMLQRDYAQGRATAKCVRDRFLTSLFDALKDSSPLNLDFIYGELVEGIFQVIDGQQRLTTLFLLHWYLARVSEKSHDFGRRMKDGEITRFRYSVRPGSDRFFAKLLDCGPVTMDESLEAQIKDRCWFFASWNHDPTVVGALTMLDAIREKSRNAPDLETYYEKLVGFGEPLITFDVLDLGSSGLSDDIYVKMNARGKELTGFEKFKPWLIGKFREKLRWPEDAGDSAQWPVLLDGEWLDFFWGFHAKSEKPAGFVSKAYFRTFVALAVNFRASEDSFNPKWLRADSNEREDSWEDLFSEDVLEAVFKGLEILSHGMKNAFSRVKNVRRFLEKEKVEMFSDTFVDEVFFEVKGEGGATYKSRLWLHAFCVFFENGMELERENGRHWFRIIRNLLENTDIREENFANCVKSISGFGRESKGKGTVLEAMAEYAKMLGMDSSQVEEESRKACLILTPGNGGAWEEAIIAAENDRILRGRIELLIPDDDDLERFKERWIVFDSLFEEGTSKIGKAEYLLARALLSLSDPINLEWQEQIHLDDKRDKWTDLIQEGGYLRQAMLRLLDKLHGEKDIKSTMREMCQCVSFDEHWMRDVILHGEELLKDSWHRKIQRYYHNGIFLYAKSNANGADVLLGRHARWRNCVIESLLSEGWKFDMQIDSVSVESEVPFYRGHMLSLSRGGTWRANFYGTRIVVNEKVENAPDEKWKEFLRYDFNLDENEPSEDSHQIVEKIKGEMCRHCEKEGN